MKYLNKSFSVGTENSAAYRDNYDRIFGKTPKPEKQPEIDRCRECGSWEAQCSAPGPVPGCACARCLRANIDRVTRERDEARAEAKEWQQHAALEPERAAVSMQRWMDITKQQQANAEKAEARVAELEAALRDIVAIGERCNCSGYLGPCGCGDRAEDCAREALGEES